MNNGSPILSPIAVTQILDELTQAATAATTSDQFAHNSKARKLYEAAISDSEQADSMVQ
jgi:hypothetical protein